MEKFCTFVPNHTNFNAYMDTLGSGLHLLQLHVHIPGNDEHMAQHTWNYPRCFSLSNYANEQVHVHNMFMNISREITTALMSLMHETELEASKAKEEIQENTWDPTRD